MNKKQHINYYYTLFGKTVEMAQVLEIEVGNVVIAFISMFSDTIKLSKEEIIAYKNLIDEINSKTLGNLLNKIRNIINFDDLSLKIIERGLQQRNYLIHNFCRSHNFAVFSIEGREKMIKELKEIRFDLLKAHSFLSLITKSLGKINGKNVEEKKIQYFIKNGKSLEI